jgi:flagellar hook-associated protein 2
MASSIHVGGLTSGTDYAGMIDSLMEVKEVLIDQEEAELEELDYDLGAWTEVQSLATDLTDSLDTLRGYDLWNSMIVESSYESVLTATADAGSIEQTYTVVVSQMATAQSISSDAVDTSTDLISAGLASENDVITIEGIDITIEAGETLSSLRTKINSAALEMDDDNAVQASIVSDHLVITRQNTGEGSITLSDTTGSVLQNLGVLDGTGVIVNEDVAGLNAAFTVNGISVSTASNDQLDDVIDGLTISLEGVGTSTIDIHPDRDAVETAILDFVEKYNALAELVDEYTANEFSSSSELSYAGELYGEPLINSIRSGLRSMVTDSKSEALDATNASYDYDDATGIMDSLSDIGIWTSSEDNSISVVDQDRFDAMLEYEYDNMYQLFKGVYDEDAIAYQNGVASDFYSYADKLSTSLTGDIAVKITSLTEEYDALSDEIEEMEDDLVDYEQELWDEFTLMEEALADLEYQTEYITAMFSSSS